MQRRPLFWQVFPTYVLLTAFLLALLVLESKGRLREFYLNQTAANLSASAALFAEAADLPLRNGRYEEVDALAKRMSQRSGLRITVVLPNGRVVAESAEDPTLLDRHRTRPEIAIALDSGEPAHDVRFSDTLQQEFLYVAVPLLSEQKEKGKEDDANAPPNGDASAPRPNASEPASAASPAVREPRPWAVVRVSMPATAVDDALRQFEERIVWGSLIAALVVLAASWLIVRRISRPLETITRVARRFGQGDFEHRLPVGGSQEIAALAETLNDVASQLHARIQSAAVERSRQEAVLRSMEEGVLTLDNQGTILDMNRAAERMFSVEAAKVRGRPIYEVLRRADVLRFFEDALSHELPVEEDLVIYDKDRRFLTVHGSALLDAQGQRIGVLAVFRDAPRRD